MYARYEHFFFFSFSFFFFQFPIFNFHFNFHFSIFNFPGVLALGVGMNRTFCAFVSPEFCWTRTAVVHIMPVSSSWRRSGAAAMAKPRNTCAS